MTPEARTVEVDIMTLFNEINRKLDSLPATIALKADSISVDRLQDKFIELSIHGSANSQKAEAGVTELKEKISALGWRVAIAMGSAILAVAGTVFVGLKK